MATRNQQTTRSGRDARHAPRSEPALPSTWLSDDQWLAWAWDQGLDLRDRDDLLDAASVGLSVLCWRNMSLENVHAGVRALGQLDSEPDPEVRAEQERAEQSYDEALFADWDVLAEADPRRVSPNRRTAAGLPGGLRDTGRHHDAAEHQHGPGRA